MLERVGLSIGHRLADANRCQLTNKALIDRLIFRSSVSSIIQALIIIKPLTLQA